MGLSMGAFKEIYRNQGIYWDGGFNLDGTGYYPTIQDARAAVDRMHAETERREEQERQDKLTAGAIRCVRSGDSITVHSPDGPQTLTIRQFRQRVFQIEEQYGAETVIV